MAEDGVFAAVEKARRFAGGFLVLDGPEHLLAHSAKPDRKRSRDFARELALGFRLTGLRAVVNLNCAAPPSWAGDLAEGPLFAGQRMRLRRNTWPLGGRFDAASFCVPTERRAGADRLASVRARLHARSRAASDDDGGIRVERGGRRFVFDRPRRPVSLAEGVDRQHPAVLLTVGLHLPRLAEQPGVDGDPTRFLKKLGSLARLALSAAVQKREFLRRQERFQERFYPRPGAAGRGPRRPRRRCRGVHRRRLLLGQGVAGFRQADRADAARRSAQDGGACRLATCLDGPDDFRLGDGTPTLGQVAGLTAWDATAPPKNQLRRRRRLARSRRGRHGGALLSDEPRPTAETVRDALRSAWKQTDVNRVRLLRGGMSPEKELGEEE